MWGINNIRSIFFNPHNEEELVLTIKNKTLVLNLRSKKIIFHHKHSTNSVGIDSESNAITINSQGQLKTIDLGNKRKTEVSTDEITPNKITPIITFIGADHLKKIIVASNGDNFSAQPSIQIFTEKPSFMEIQKRQYTGVLSKLRKQKL